MGLQSGRKPRRVGAEARQGFCAGGSEGDRNVAQFAVGAKKYYTKDASGTILRLFANLTFFGE
jgi:hypothetical protein